jgi:cardiolipin synthase C
MIGILGDFALGVVIIAAGFGLYVIAMRAVFVQPLRRAERDTSTFAANAQSALAKEMAPQIAAHPLQSGVAVLNLGSDAFAARMALAATATVSIDAQYYIWDDGVTGRLLLGALQDAANRGVSVRILVDDNGTMGLDQALAALDAHPLIEVRIFNPFVLRRARFLNYSFDFFRLNRRMHNKSFTVDGTITILGGRNIGDLYFETDARLNYIDLDVLAVGPAATDVSADFARYWACPHAHPVKGLITPLPDCEKQFQTRLQSVRATALGKRAAAQMAAFDLKSLPLIWVRATVFSDDPAKIMDKDCGRDRLIQRLLTAIGPPLVSVDLISAYFIPGAAATQRLAHYAARGVRVRTLTNALESTDVAVVHAGYAPYRRAMIASGVEVYELRSDGDPRRRFKDFDLFDLSKAALHAKGFSVDRQRVFIGSLNFDPRSRLLNTEMGLLIDSPKIAGDISDWLDENLPRFAYRLTLSRHNGLIWTGQDAAGAATVFQVEPNTTLPLRLMIAAVGLLPLQWLM